MSYLNAYVLVEYRNHFHQECTHCITREITFIVTYCRCQKNPDSVTQNCCKSIPVFFGNQRLWHSTELFLIRHVTQLQILITKYNLFTLTEVRHLKQNNKSKISTNTYK